MRPPVNRRLRILEDAVLKSESADERGLKFEDPLTSESECDGQRRGDGAAAAARREAQYTVNNSTILSHLQFLHARTLTCRPWLR